MHCYFKEVELPPFTFLNEGSQTYVKLKGASFSLCPLQCKLQVQDGQ
jgi:hypothetical protein